MIEINPTTFKIDKDGQRQSIVGDSASELFLPCVEIQPWEGDCLKVFFDTTASLQVNTSFTDKERLIWSDSKYSFVFTEIATDKENHLVDLKTPGVKFKLRTIEKPKIDLDGFARFSFKMSGHEDFEFVPQPALTEEEVNEGKTRADHVVDSLAVYHKTKNNNQYGTGKVCPIYRPWCKDSEGNFTWGKWEYDLQAGTITKCIPRKAFDYNDATFWDIDATFGNTSRGSSLVTGYDGTCGYSSHKTASEGGTTSQIHAFVKSTSGLTRHIKLALYDDDAANAEPEDQFAAEAEGEVAAGFDSATAEATIDINYVATFGAEKCWFAFVQDYNAVQIYYDTGVSGERVRETLASNYDLPATWGTGAQSDSTDRLSIYVTYAAAGGLSIPIAMYHHMHH